MEIRGDQRINLVSIEYFCNTSKCAQELRWEKEYVHIFKENIKDPEEFSIVHDYFRCKLSATVKEIC